MQIASLMFTQTVNTILFFGISYLINLSRQSLIWMVFHTLRSRLLGVSVQTFMCLCTCWAVQLAVHLFCGWCDSHPLLTLTIKSEVLKPRTVRKLLVLVLYFFFFYCDEYLYVCVSDLNCPKQIVVLAACPF